MESTAGTAYGRMRRVRYALRKRSSLHSRITESSIPTPKVSTTEMAEKATVQTKILKNGPGIRDDPYVVLESTVGPKPCAHFLAFVRHKEAQLEVRVDDFAVLFVGQ